MVYVAILFLILVVLRVVLFTLDLGFGGTIWDAIMYVSIIAWVLGVAMAFEVLGWLPRLVW